MNHTIFSPHSDDAVLCCGGMMARFIDIGDSVTVHTIFCALPERPYSPLAEEFHAKWGNPDNMVRLRRAEDEAAAAKLGAGMIYGPLHEPLYRVDENGEWMYFTVQDIFSPRHPADDRLVSQLIGYISAVPDLEQSRLYFPLGIGQHIDHLITFEAGLHFHGSGFDVVFYEDFPYAIRGNSLQERLGQLQGFTSRTVTMEEAHLQAKIEAFGYYRSQIPMLFQQFDRVPEIFRNYASAVAGDGRSLAERLWVNEQK